MRQWNISLPSRRQEFDIALPGRVREAKLWIRELAFQNQVKAVMALLTGAAAAAPRKRLSVKPEGTVKASGKAGIEKYTAVRASYRTAVDGRTARPTMEENIRAGVNGQTLSGGRLGRSMRLLAPRPLRDADPMTLLEMDNISLAALDYTVLEEW